MERQPLVSVCVQTYNQAPYIAQCLDSILMQETDFPLEIILGEDESSDGTREICIDYANRYPDKIRLFLRKREDVIYIGGRPTGRYNFIENLKASRGKYIAICEGDDYWTDPEKLQRQIDFLEANQNFSICFHKIKILEGGIFKEDYITKVPSEVTTIEDLAKGNYIHTPSCVFRNRVDNTIGEHIYESAIGDYYLHMMNAQYGKIYYMDREMAVYRIHDDSYWSTQPNEYRFHKTVNSQRAILLDFLDKESNGYNTLFQSYVDNLFKLHYILDSQEWENEILKNTNELSQLFAKSLMENLKKIKMLEAEKKSIKKTFKGLVRLTIKRITN
jgi:glycosyltransferase involved in cell wall biosynthesis